MLTQYPPESRTVLQKSSTKTSSAPWDAMRKQLPPRVKHAVTERPMKLSPGMLELMSFAHRVIGMQSLQLENAASELFRRCERMRNELATQVNSMTELAQQLKHLSDNSGEGEHGDSRREKVPERRINEAKERQKRLVARYEALRRKVGRVGSAKRELTSKELAWVEEIDTLGENIGVASEQQEEQEGARKGDGLDKRFEAVSLHALAYFKDVITNYCIGKTTHLFACGRKQSPRKTAATTISSASHAIHHPSTHPYPQSPTPQ